MSSDSESSSGGSLPSNKRHRSDADLPEFVEEEGEENVVNTSRSKGVITASLVIRKAHQMVEDCSQDHPHIVCWNREGDRFEVKDKEALEENILPQYFNHSVFSSFSKQMNVYGFLKWKTEPIKKTEAVTDSFMFQHEYFRRGRLDLLKHIKRKPTRSSRNKKAKTSPGEVQNLEQRLAAVEEIHSVFKSTIQKLEQANYETKATVEMMRKQDSQKNEDMKAQDMRIQQLEQKLSAVLQQHQPNNGNSYDSIRSQQVPIALPRHNNFAPGQTSAQLTRADTTHGNRIVSGSVTTSSNGNTGPTLRPHPNKKSLALYALPSPTPVGTGSTTLRPHPNKKSLSCSSFGFGESNGADPLAHAVFRETSGDSLGALLARYDSLGASV